MSIRSMTGFAQVKGQVNGQFGFTLSLKSVNHRFLDIHFRMPSDSDDLEMKLRRRLKERMARGHVELTLNIERGVSGSLRANVVPGELQRISDPTTKEWFNTAAFCQPETTTNNPTATCVNAADSTYGDAGRNILEGPGQVTVDMSLNKTITIKEYRSLDLRITANNIFNTVNFTSLNTVVNSTSFGEVTGAGTMRRLTVQARFRF